MIELIEHVLKRRQWRTVIGAKSYSHAHYFLTHGDRNNSVSHIIAQDYSQHYLVHKKFSQIGEVGIGD